VRVEEAEALERLASLVGSEAECAKASALRRRRAAAFRPRRAEGQPNMLLAEAGTGIGKTLGYLAPASCGRRRPTAPSGSRPTPRRSSASSTARAAPLPRPEERKRRIVVRKGRENYLCLLNLEDALQGGFRRPRRDPRAARRPLGGLFARTATWSAATCPGWLSTLFRRAGATALTDRRGECVYAGCPHYRKCFIERSARASADADSSSPTTPSSWSTPPAAATTRPSRIVFDEGHHLFDRRRFDLRHRADRARRRSSFAAG
jgi:ATP-dependent DNA helicase DinG